jgi:glycosyltransferase involved in cell wall biosynthesis
LPTLLSINNYFYRRDGSEVIFQDHNRLFESRGWQVVPFCMHHPDNPESPWAEYFVTEIEFGSTYSLWDKVIRIPKVIYSLEARRKLRALLDRVRPDVAHCHTIYHHISPSILGVLKKLAVPTVMTLHDFKLICPAYHLFNKGAVCEKCAGGRVHHVLANQCIKGSLSLSSVIMAEGLLHNVLGSYRDNVDFFISPCRFYIDKFVSWGWDRRQFVHIPNFVDASGFQPRYAPGKSVVYFGRLSPEKGLLNLIRAAARARVSLRLLGAGPQAEQLHEEALKTGADAVFAGHLTGEALHAEIQASRATVLPAEWYENAPMSVLESYALGKPVIAADIGGMSEIVSHGESGWLFASGSIEQLADRLRSVADMPDSQLAEMGRKARHRVETEFTESLYQERIAELYSSMGVLEERHH